ncbi:cell wall-binding repeat-containing protein [Halobacillus salinarum]|uniref:Cell wall-binding repeat-containing protein n=1 Tax=Halobacillus salinarum TaxID=2932257 RepID=A0ABY4ENC3_9BACI|nr:cell wall-binding repeat-containing protein [Halobacillus salinarum]UOQ45694.1 cell wall-binding repeat-containing protein [Halobacillus salinarum]
MKKKSFARGMNTALIGSLVFSLISGPVYTVKAADNTEKPDTLLISEYIEGSSYNKALELYNGTGSDIDLSTISVELHSGGAEAANTTYTLSGTLADGDVFVLSHSSANAQIQAETDVNDSEVINFNGNDTIVIKQNGKVIDSLGQIGSADDFAKDVTLTRKTGAITGDTDLNDTVDLTASYTEQAKDTVSFLGKYPDETTTPGPVEEKSIAEARDSTGEVKVTGVITAAFEVGGSTNYYIQDDTAGLIVRTSDVEAETGDEITAQGQVSSYYGMQQIQTSEDKVSIKTEDKGVPSPQNIKAANLSDENGEDTEGEFVALSDVEITKKNEDGSYTGTDTTGDFLIELDDSLQLEVGKTYELMEGVVNYTYDHYRLMPRNQSDIVEKVFSVTANPGQGNIVKGGEVTLNTAEAGASIHYTMDGSTPDKNSQEFTEAITIDEDTTIKAVAVKPEGETSEVSTFSYHVLKPADNLDIHDIQGASHESPYKNKNVSNVDGIVTKTNSKGFYMQDEEPDNDSATSEGIYVYAPDSDAKVKDRVKVNGEVQEYREEGYEDAADLLTTEISASNVEVTASNQTLPDPMVIGKDRTPPTEVVENDKMTSFDPGEDGLDFYESMEGMLIEMDDAHVVAPPKYDEIAVYVNKSENQPMTDAGGLLISEEDYNPERIMIDVDGFDVNVKTGDQFEGAITGVVSYDYSNFKIRPTGTFPEVVDGGTERETTQITPSEEKLNIASYNIENFSAETSMEKVNKLAESINNNLKTPDIIGLIEVQDNNGPTDDGTVDASKSYEKLIDAIKADGGPEYKYTDIAPKDKTDGGQPGGNIRVGFIYNPARVTMPDKPKGDAVTAVDVNETGLTFNPGRIDPTNDAFYDSRKPLAAEFEFQGEKVIVVANHLNSKGGDDALFGASHPVELGSEVQRMKQAEVVNSFVDKVESKVDHANVVVLGDLNDFEFSKPVKTLADGALTDMVNKLPQEERYSYVYQGNSQVLDHILVSNNLTDRTAIDSVNINSDFSEEDGRASDHDPMLAQLDLSTQVDRVSGTDRFKSAIEMSKKGWDKSDTIVISRGDSFPDALAGTPLAYKLDAPILLTKTSRLLPEVKQEIKRLGAKHAVILGGEGAIDSYVRYQLEGIGLSVERVSGTNRFKTASSIAARLDGQPKKAVIADGDNYPDALAAASYAAEKGYPILLTQGEKLPNATKRALSNIEETIVVGGPGAVSNEVMAELPSPTRYSGTNRYETAAEIAKLLVGQSKDAYVATGENFADALTGSVLAAKNGAPMLLVQPEEIPESMKQVIENMGYRDYHILGGPNAVSEDVKDKLDH